MFLVNALTDTNPGGGGVGSGNAGDLRYALTASDAAGGANTVAFQSGLSGTILLRAALPDIASNLNLDGPAVSPVTVDGNRFGSVLDVAAGETVSISDLTITGGNGSPGGGGLTDGGGILNNRGATLTVSNCIITGNAGASMGGGIFNGGTLTVANSILSGNAAVASGGGIMNVGTLTVSDSTLSGNALPDSGQSQGGGIASAGDLTLSNSTVSGNFAQFGGGLLVIGTMVVSDCTISDNSAQLGGGIANEGTFAVLNSTITGNVVSGGRGGGIYQPASPNGPITLHDTIVAGNSALNGAAGPDVSGAVASSVVIAGATYREGYNLVGNGTGSRGFMGSDGDQVGTSARPIFPRLGPLQNNGGPTPTFALMPGSPAINAGDPSNRGALPQFDQRGFGFPRVVANRVDIGAFESRPQLGSARAFLRVASGPPQGVRVGTAYAPLVARVTDSRGNAVTGATVIFAVAPGRNGAAGTFADSAVVTTNSRGFAAAPTLTANTIAGAFSVTARVAGVITPAIFRLTNLAGPRRSRWL